MSQNKYTIWNYFVLKINLKSADEPANPERASEKLKGTLSPAFLQKQFPNEYKEVNKNKSMEVQIQEALGKLGAKGWELINVTSVGSILLFYFKRPNLNQSD